MGNISSSLIKYLVKNGDKSIAQKELEDILNRDIHDSSLGCKISNTHVRIGKVHLDTFYEAQLLFGNAYWTDIFAYYLYNFVLNRIKEIPDFNDKQPIILYGYETYSSLTLNKAMRFLQEDGFDVNLRIFEIRNQRVRYCDIDKDGKLDESLLNRKPVVFFFVGISSTLSTFYKMNENICKLNLKYNEVTKFCTSVIQICGTENNMDHSTDFIYVNTSGKENYVLCQSEDKYLDFIINDNMKKAYFYVSVKSTWFIPEKCKLCLPNNYLQEYPLIEVNESSVVPTQMIRLNNFEANINIEDPASRFGDVNISGFLKDISNSKYLYYNHIERSSNHFQYYFRLSRLYHDKKDDIELWLKAIKSNYDFIFSSEKSLNIIVAPQNYSNTGFINSVNNIIFKGTAHIMSFDIHKEYRSNFKAKYNNYRELEKIINELDDYCVNFYFVNDQIISGNTFQRTKSLIRSLFSEKREKLKIFNGVFVLLNRNSFETRCNYVDFLENNDKQNQTTVLPYFSYLNLAIPSLRSFGDSCPICFNRNKFKKIIEECALDNSVYHWQKKVINYTTKSVVEARNESKIRFTYDNNGFKFLQCENDLWKCVASAYDKISEQNSLVTDSINDSQKKCIILEKLYECIYKRLDSLSDLEKIEYLILYIKIFSRELLYYQEDIKKACIYFLLKIFDYFLSETYMANESSNFPIGDNLININLCSSAALKYDLYRVVISRLCSVGSCALLNPLRLQKCRNIGKNMEIELEKDTNDFDELLLHCIKKLLCYDQGRSKSKLLSEMLQITGVTETFYIKLYLENLRIIDTDAIVLKSDSNKMFMDLKQEDIHTKYELLTKFLKSLCIDDKEDHVKIQISAFGNSERKKVVNITKETLASEDEYDSDFIYNEQDNTYHITIGNNFDKLKYYLKKDDRIENIDRILEKDLGITKSAIILLKIKTTKIENVVRILKYRFQIMQMVQEDFNNNAIAELMIAEERNKDLSEQKNVTHSHDPLSEYSSTYERIVKHRERSKLENTEELNKIECDFLRLYMDTIISLAHREYLRFVEHKYASFEQEHPVFAGTDYNSVKPYCALKYAESLIQMLPNRDSIRIQFAKGDFEDPRPLNSIEEVAAWKRIAEENDMQIIRIAESPNEKAMCYMLLNTFIENAYRHSNCTTDPKVEVYLIDNKSGGYDLLVQNEVGDNNIHSSKDSGITLIALKYILRPLEEVDVNESLLIIKENNSDDNLYKIGIKNFIIKEIE